VDTGRRTVGNGLVFPLDNNTILDTNRGWGIMRCFVILLSVFLFGISLSSPGQTAGERDQLSGTSLRLTIRHDEVDLGVATGFVLQKNQHYYLITNRHVVLGCAEDKDPNDAGGWLCANNLRILHNRANRVGEWFPVTEQLYDEHEAKRWLEHPALGSAEHPTPGSSVDLVALPLRNREGVAFLVLDLELRKTPVHIAPGDTVSIVGFPHGLAQVAGLAIWKTGTIASDPDVNFEGKAKFLLDTTARGGMSGSPVYARRTIDTEPGGQLVTYGSPKTRFLGVYSEQSEALEIGVVWKAEMVQSLYDSLP
jgi:hypothetical protein